MALTHQAAVYIFIYVGGAFSKRSVFGHQKRRFSVDGRQIRRKKLRYQIYPA